MRGHATASARCARARTSGASDGRRIGLVEQAVWDGQGLGSQPADDRAGLAGGNGRLGRGAGGARAVAVAAVISRFGLVAVEQAEEDAGLTGMVCMSV